MSLSDVVEQNKVFVKNNGGAVSEALDFGDVKQNGLVISKSAKGGGVLDRAELIAIPEGLVLTPRVARKLLTDGWPAAKQAVASLPDEAAMALGLLRERDRKDSVLKPLLDELPTAADIHAAPMWRDEELTWLSGSFLGVSITQVREGVRGEWKAAISALEAAGIDVKAESALLNAEDYAWAAAVVDARAMSISRSEPLVLAPLAQLCLVSPPWEEASAQIACVGGLFFSRRRFVLSATRSLVPGAAVTLPADATSNADFLMEHGIAFSDSRAHSVNLNFEVAQLDRFFDDKRDTLQRVGMDANKTFTLTAPDRRGLWTPPDDLDAFLRLTCLTGADAFLLEPVFRRDLWNFMQLPVSADNEAAVCQLVIGACEDALDAYFPSLNGENPPEDQFIDDASLLRWRLAKVVICGEKDILHAAKAHYERTAESLDVLEYYAERRLKALDLLRPLDDSEIVDSESGAQVGRAFDENYR